MANERYKSASAFRAALDVRMRTIAAERNLPLQTVRLKLVMERLLARLFHSTTSTWLLKGGYATELRYRPQARTTKDIDLTISTDSKTRDDQRSIDRIHEELVAAASEDLDDFFQFRIEKPTRELRGAPEGGFRFPCECLLGGKTFARFHLDIGFGDVLTGRPETLLCDDLLSFAGIKPATVRAIPLRQQFAEKIHAYTFPWTDRPNTRVKDLVDLLLFIERGMMDPAELKDSIHKTFEKRGTHPIPKELVAPPKEWAEEYTAMANEAKLSVPDVADGYDQLRKYWDDNELGM